MDKDENKIYTQSIRCAAFITYSIGEFPTIKAFDKGNTFVFDKSLKALKALNTYKKSQYNKDVLMGDLNAYDDICKQLKRMCKEHVGA
ncbi:hypothetical protein HMPREF1982_03539 [Clostridiales bacterium oral taxon 876 str. F0540]|nr:hypothetical protein HMPREF1982_03539 [Clostridiales bacterium oral taxon 876 str. F0540]